MFVMIGSLRLISTLLCFQTAAGFALKKTVVSRRVVTFALSGGAHRIFSSSDNAKKIHGEVDRSSGKKNSTTRGSEYIQSYTEDSDKSISTRNLPKAHPEQKG